MVWFHTGRPEEKMVMEDQVRRFNAANQDMRVELTLIPEGEYNTQVQATAADGRLPDLLDLDGPYLYNYAWKGHLVPLDNYLSADIKKRPAAFNPHPGHLQWALICGGHL